MTPRRSGVWLAAALVVTALAVLLVAWFVAGWTEVGARQQAVLDAPGALAERRGVELSRELRSELAGVLARETQRPYFHYQNLFHDPRVGGNSWNVTPSPLAGRPDEPYIRGYFQIDRAGHVTTPTINDEVPDLSDAKYLADNRRFRDEVTHSLSGPLAEARPLVAKVDRPGQVVAIDNESYVQNSNANLAYRQQQAIAPPRPPEVAPRPVMVTISPLEWRTLAFAGAPALVAVRSVETPDGNLVQGFVVDRAALATWLRARAGESVSELRTGDGGAEVAPGWHVAVDVDPAARASAAAEVSAIARAFLLRFIGVGLVSLLAGALAVLVVARAERLARERSQFAAAAAHELRTPLAGLQLYGDMLADGLGDPTKLRDYARRMSEEASRLGRVVSNVLGFSQLERGNLSVDPLPSSVTDALRELAERAQPALDRAGAALELDVGPELTARFDRDALARIIGNLLDNAEKYGRGAPDRTIALTARASGAEVEVVVADRGPGVAAAARPKLFRPFARGVAGDGPAGLGLGLALSQSLARAMGGELSYRPAPDGGAAFVLRLPH
jgi:signal transduction histidine kinase